MVGLPSRRGPLAWPAGLLPLPRGAGPACPTGPEPLWLFMASRGGREIVIFWIPPGLVTVPYRSRRLAMVCDALYAFRSVVPSYDAEVDLKLHRSQEGS